MLASPIKARVESMDWKSDTDAEFMGLDFYFEGSFGESPPPNKVFVFKPRRFLDIYAEVLGHSPTHKVFELGIWRGGSAILLAALFDVKKLVCIDLSDEVVSFDALRAEHPIGRRISPHYRTSQDDEAKLNAILDQEFDGPPDLIIDDASHLYGPSRASFEILYPRLRPGGWYVIEDWAWAHAMLPIWPDEPSLAGLIFELQLAMACNVLFDEVIVRREMVFFKKPLDAPVSCDRLNLTQLYTLHHRSPPLVK